MQLILCEFGQHIDVGLGNEHAGSVLAGSPHTRTTPPAKLEADARLGSGNIAQVMQLVLVQPSCNTICMTLPSNYFLQSYLQDLCSSRSDYAVCIQLLAGIGAVPLLQLKINVSTSTALSPESSVAAARLLRHMDICLLLPPTA